MTFETQTVSVGDRSYDIFFDRGIYSVVQEWIRRFHPGRSVYVVTDQNVASIYGDDIQRWLSVEPKKMLALLPGEEHKTLFAIGKIYEFLCAENADRDSIVVAFGGGVVGDLAGFAAATFLRGISFIQIPTTLLAMLDSSVGGKTGVNLPEGKNLVGVFQQPRAVFIDDTFLVTLDDRNLRAGLAEAVKSALAGDARLWEWFSGRGSQWKTFSGDDWRELIRRSVAFKISVVERDERESHLRKILNLGHTIGHALEQSGGYGRLLHGEAVAAGLAWEAVLGLRLGVTAESVVNDVLSLLLEMGYELDVPEIPLASIEAALGADKKRVVSDVDLPLIVRPGECRIQRVPLEKIREELVAVRAEIRARASEPEDGKRELDAGELQGAVRFLERQVAANPRDNRAITFLADAYRKAGNMAAAWEAVQEVLGRNPSDPFALRVAAELEKPLSLGVSAGEDTQAVLPFEDLIVVGEDAYRIRVADAAAPLAEEGKEPQSFGATGFASEGEMLSRHEEPVSEMAVTAPESPVSDSSPEGAVSVEVAFAPVTETPEKFEAMAGELPEEPGEKPVEEKSALPLPKDSSPVGTVTLADLYWAQGERSAARKIVRRILESNPGDARARDWVDSHGEEDPVESALEAFLDSMVKEFGYELSRYH